MRLEESLARRVVMALRKRGLEVAGGTWRRGKARCGWSRCSVASRWAGREKA